MLSTVASTGVDWKYYVSVLLGVLGFIGVIVTLAVNGRRAERARRRELYANGWAAVQAYKEFAFAVRRRNIDDRGAERVRLSDQLSLVQRDLAYYETLIGRERSRDAAGAYGELVSNTRRIAGGIIRRSWNEEPIAADREMHSPAIAEELQALNPWERTYMDSVSSAI